MGFIAGVKRTATIVAKTKVMVMKVTASLIDKASLHCQLRFKDVFLNTMVRRLSYADEVITGESEPEPDPNTTQRMDGPAIGRAC